MKTTSIIRNTKLPNFIRDHKIFEKMEEIDKIFPKLGLTNCCVKANSIDYSEEASKAFRHRLSYVFRAVDWAVDRAGMLRVAKLIGSCEPKDFIVKGKLDIPVKLQERYSNLHRTYRNMRYGAHYLGTPRAVFRVNLIRDNHHIVFSSKGMQGAWDIATMSMRGISSCQGWRGCYKRNLVGSIVDPFVGVLYLTDNTQLKHGSKMLRRALVRYVVHKETNKPALMLERIYPNQRNYPVAEPEILGLFIQFLKNKTEGKLPIVTSESARQYSIPNSEAVRTLSSCGHFHDGRDYCRSYRDSDISYSRSSLTRIKAIKPF